MTDRWRPSPSVLNGRRVRMRGFLTRKSRPFYILGESSEQQPEEPSVPSASDKKDAVKVGRTGVVFEADLPIDSIARELSRRETQRQGRAVIPLALTRPYHERPRIAKLSHVPDHSDTPRLNLLEPVTDPVLIRVQGEAARKQRQRGHR